MKKFIALTVCVSLMLPSAVFAADLGNVKQKGADVVAAATTAPAKPAPTTPGKPAPTKPATEQSTNNGNPYADGVYVTYGPAYSKGTEGAKVTIKDGKIADIELMRTSPKLIDRDARFNYKDVWRAYEPMKERFLGKTREEAQKVDTVAGATRSCDAWKLSVERAFMRALKVKPAKEFYFEGEHMGIDPLGKYAVFAKFDKTKFVEAKVYPMNAKGDILEAAAMTEEQKKAVEALTSALNNGGANDLIYQGKAMTVKGYESDAHAVINAFWDAEQNAKINNTVPYVDGVYSAYGEARDKGVERADIAIRNGKLVDVKLYRLGANLIDRGTTAYETVVKANAPLVEKLLANGTYFATPYVDGITGATESVHSWNIAIERAFEKAAKAPTKNQYFDGIFAGVDSTSNVLVLVEMKDDKATKVTTHLFGADKKLIKEEALTLEQKDLVAKLNAGLLAQGANLVEMPGHEMHYMAAKYAYMDALANASTKQSNYKDGKFTAYGDANDKGNNRVDVTLRNGKIVDISLFRVGANYEDRGETAYPDVIKAIPIMKERFMKAATREAVQKVDTVAGATSSINAFKLAIERAFNQAEIIKTEKVAYQNGVHGGLDKAKSVYVMVTVENNLPSKMVVHYFDGSGKIKAVDKLTADERVIKQVIEAGEDQPMHKFGYRPAPLEIDSTVKALSAKVVEAINAALATAGR